MYGGGVDIKKGRAVFPAAFNCYLHVREANVAIRHTLKSVSLYCCNFGCGALCEAVIISTFCNGETTMSVKGVTMLDTTADWVYSV